MKKSRKRAVKVEKIILYAVLPPILQFYYVLKKVLSFYNKNTYNTLYVFYVYDDKGEIYYEIKESLFN